MMMRILQWFKKKPTKLALMLAYLTVYLFFLNKGAYAQDALIANGKNIETTTGERVVLKGLNLGQWLVMEGFMSGDAGTMSQVDMKRALFDNGSSKTDIEGYFQLWRDNFITKDDIDYIASKGFNCVRIPLHYELFLTDEQRDYRNEIIYLDDTAKATQYDTYKTALQSWVDNDQLAESDTIDGFQIIDSLVSWCESNNLYIILDMHIVPGTVGDKTNITDEIYEERGFFNDFSNRATLYTIWDKISERYKDENTICMYDLVNEPHGLSDTQMGQLRNSFNQIINNIRNNNDDKLIIIQGTELGNQYKRTTGVNSLFPSDFTVSTNLVYSIHRYRLPNNITESNPWGHSNHVGYFKDAIDFQNTYNVPMFVGETGLDDDYSRLQGNFEIMEQLGFSWALWSFKHHTVDEKTNWRCPVDISGNDPYDDLTIWGNGTLFDNIKFENCTVNDNSSFWAALTSTLDSTEDITQSYYQLVNKNSNMPMRLSSPYNAESTYAKQDDDAGTYNSSQWYFEESNISGYYNIINKGSGELIIAKSGTDGDSITIRNVSNSNYSRSKWALDETEDGYYNLKNYWPGYYLQPAGGSADDDVHLISKSFEDTDAYKWELKKISVKNTHWTNTGWSNGVPDNTIDIIINSNEPLDTDITCKKITINSGIQFNIATGTNVTATSSITNNGLGITGNGVITFDTGGTISLNESLTIDGTLKIENGTVIQTNGNLTLNEGAILLHESSNSIDGTVTASRTGSEVTLAYNFWSIPFQDGKKANEIPENNRYIYNEPSASWTTIPDSINVGTGVIGTGAGTIQMTGIPFADNVTVPVTAQALNATYKGFNLIGNPYLAPLDYTAFVATNTNIEGGNLYYYVGNADGTGAYTTVNNSNIQNIPSFQSFFIKVTTDGTIDFLNAHKLSTGNTNFFRQEGDPIQTQLSLQLKDQDYKDGIEIVLGESFLLSNDYGYDADKKYGDQPLGIAIQSQTAQSNIALPHGVYTLPLAVDLQKSAELKLTTLKGENVSIILRDKQTGKGIDLTQQTATLETGDTNRYALEIASKQQMLSLGNTIDQVSMVIKTDGFELNNLQKGGAAITVLDITGKVLFQSKIQNNHSSWSGNWAMNTNRVLLVSITNADNTIIRKIMFR